MPPPALLGQAAVILLRGRWRWVAFLSAILVSMVAGGSAFLFPVYSKAIVASLGYDDDIKALGMLAFSKNLGASLGFLPSTLIYEVAPPWAVLRSVAAVHLLGVLAAYLLPYLAIAGHMARPPLWVMCIFVALGANSQSFAVTGALVSSVKNLPDHRGPVLSVLLAFAGLGGDILAQFGRASGGSALLLFMACLDLVLLLFACNSIRVIPVPAGAARSAGDQGRGVRRVFWVSVFAGACLLVFHVVDLAVADLPRRAYYVAAIFIATALIISLAVVAVKQQQREREREREQEQEQEPERSPARTTAAPPGPGGVPSTPSSSFLQELYSILRSVLTLEILLIFLVTFVIGGSVQTPIDIIDQIGQSLQYKHGTTSKMVSLVSLLDYAGRLVGGFGSEYMVARFKLPRPLALTAAFLLACFGQVLIALGVPDALYVAAPIMGFCLGALWTVVFVTISELFGNSNMAALYNLALLPTAVASYLFNVQVAGRLYARELQRQASTHNTCIGVHCFSKSLLILFGVTLFGAVVSEMLAFKAWTFYRAPADAAASGVVAPAATVDRSSSSQMEADASSTKLEEVASMDMDVYV